MATLQDLPNELITNICDFCSLRQIKSLRQVSKSIATATKTAVFRHGGQYWLNFPLDKRYSQLPPDGVKVLRLIFTRAGASHAGWDDPNIRVPKDNGYLTKILSEMRKVRLHGDWEDRQPFPALNFWSVVNALSAAENLETLDLEIREFSQKARSSDMDISQICFVKLHTLRINTSMGGCLPKKILPFAAQHARTLRHLCLVYSILPEEKFEISELQETIRKLSVLDMFHFVTSRDVLSGATCVADRLESVLPPGELKIAAGRYVGYDSVVYWKRSHRQEAELEHTGSTSLVTKECFPILERIDLIDSIHEECQALRAQ